MDENSIDAVAKRTDGCPSCEQPEVKTKRISGVMADAIARLVEPGTSGKWHGVNCYVRTFDGDTIEVRESIFEIMWLIKSAQEAKP